MLRGGNRAGKGITPNTRSREQPTPEELPNKTARVAVAQTASNTTRNHPANTPTFPVSNVATSSSSSNKRTVSRMDNHMNPQINYINQMHPHMQQLQQLPIFHPLPPGTLTPPLRPEALAHMQAASSSTLNSAAGSEGESSEEERPSKSTGRRKIKIEYIQDRTKRNITFSKRKAGIMKKAYELSALTGTQVLLLVASENGHVYTFATPKLQPLITHSEGKNFIQSCLNAPDPDEAPQASSSSVSANPPLVPELSTAAPLSLSHLLGQSPQGPRLQ